MMQKENAEDDNDDNAMTILENIMQHLFQQAFYPVSKVQWIPTYYHTWYSIIVIFL